ncbi:MAG: ABC transporter substrate-binding protein [Crinalium sp.]
MAKRVIIRIGQGRIETGYPDVSVQIGEEGQPSTIEAHGELLPAPDLMQLLKQWQLEYYKTPATKTARIPLPNNLIISDSISNTSNETNSRIIVPETQQTNVSIQRFREADEALAKQMQKWLKSLEDLRILIQGEVAKNESVRVIFQTPDINLWKLPWHLWSLFEHRPNSELVFITNSYDKVAVRSLQGAVKILGILGNDQNITLEEDQKLIDTLKSQKGDIQWLPKPSREQLFDELYHKYWDILFFAGHSYTDRNHHGVIQINDTESLFLNELESALKLAIEKGLKLAIFNSCDGLGLALNLAKLNIPHVIVMREPVPDQVAQLFLKYFLEKFSQGTSLNQSVRYARMRLKLHEHQFPGASALPLVYENPNAPPLVWKQKNGLSRVKNILNNGLNVKPEMTKIGLILLFLLSVAIVVGVIVIPRDNNKLTSETQPVESDNCVPDVSIDSCISIGNKVLIKDNPTKEKTAGVKAFKEKKYTLAVSSLQDSLKKYPYDPETLIYKNNAQAQLTNHLKIAAVVPISTNLNFAQEMLRGVAMAQNKINQQGGINGNLLQVVIIDDSNKPEIAKQVAEKLVKDSTILAVVGHNASFATLAAAPIYQQGRLVMISPTSFTNGLSGLGDYIFRTIPRIRNLTEPLAEYVVTTLRKTRTAICYDFKSPDQTVFNEEYVEALKSKGVQTQAIQCDFSSPNFDANQVISEAVSSGADSLLLAPSIAPTNTIKKAIDVARANKVAGLTLLASTTMYTIDTLKSGGSDINGLVLAAPWSPKISSPPAKNFADYARQLWKAEVNWRTATDYDATLAIITGLKKNPTREGLKNELRSRSFVAPGGANGDIKFAPTGDPLSNNIILLEVRPSNSNPTGYDFIPIQP